MAEDDGQNPPDVEIELKIKNAEFLKKRAA
jgi:hypothetical protein